MAFKVVRPLRGGLQFNPLPAGFVSVARSGLATFHSEDLKLVKIGDLAVLFADTDGSFRVALRAAKRGEEELAVKVNPVVRKKGKLDGRRRKVNLSPAIRGLGLTPGVETAGRFELSTKGVMLIFGFIKNGGRPAGSGKPTQQRK